jgi:hypothetical protein
MRAGRKRKLGDRRENGSLCRPVGTRQAELVAPIFGDARAIYVLQVGTDAVKIGISNDPASRLRHLQSGQDRSLRTVLVLWMRQQDAVQAELAIHRRLKHTAHHARGECYYMATDTAISFVRSTLDDLGVRYLPDESVRNLLRSISAQGATP